MHAFVSFIYVTTLNQPSIFTLIIPEWVIQNTNTCESDMKFEVKYDRSETHLVVKFADSPGGRVFKIFEVFPKDRD